MRVKQFISVFLMLFAMGASQVWADPIVLFHETFGTNGTGSGASARTWNDSYSVKSGVSSVYSGVTGYTITNAKQTKGDQGSSGAGLNGTQGQDAIFIVGPLAVANYESLSVTFRWNAGSVKNNTYYAKLYYATSSHGTYSEVTGTGNGATSFITRSFSLEEAAQVSTLYLKVVWKTSNTIGKIDEFELKGVEKQNIPSCDNSITISKATPTNGSNI